MFDSIHKLSCYSPATPRDKGRDREERKREREGERSRGERHYQPKAIFACTVP